ncbi:hypothetical protein DFH08DRAFT_359972 [Mycena albidolilacea]|uniref:DUF6533 domain-containing protein n=1 Tax=Mycena albidolilacea TaxID=1033008 RepID=A0AAD7AK38_9AGAR|nr:hypothetical protein DFH08DRAFT_359972 [Mycena albidolilacea]
MAPLLTADEIGSIQGAENARVILITLFCLSVYEWMITLDDEIKYFWTGPWGMSRILFLVNRYLSPAISVLALFCVSLPNPGFEVGLQTWYSNPVRYKYRGPWCSSRWVIRATFIHSGSSYVTHFPAMLVVRVWYLFGQSRSARITMIVSFVSTNVLSLYFAVLAGMQLEVTENLHEFHGCRANRPANFWRLWLPSLVLHTLLYCLTAFRALKNRRIFKEAPILKRLLRDGGFFYFVVFISILFTAIGSFLRQYPSVNTPAIFSNFSVATTSIAASRVMLSIHSLAAKLGSDSAWLLNNIELSRVPWRQGATEGEIIVDRFGRDPDDEDEDAYELDSPSKSVVSLKMSRVGRWTDETW